MSRKIFTFPFDAAAYDVTIDSAATDVDSGCLIGWKIFERFIEIEPDGPALAMRSDAYTAICFVVIQTGSQVASNP